MRQMFCCCGLRHQSSSGGGANSAQNVPSPGYTSPCTHDDQHPKQALHQDSLVSHCETVSTAYSVNADSSARFSKDNKVFRTAAASAPFDDSLPNNSPGASRLTLVGRVDKIPSGDHSLMRDEELVPESAPTQPTWVEAKRPPLLPFGYCSLTPDTLSCYSAPHVSLPNPQSALCLAAAATASLPASSNANACAQTLGGPQAEQCNHQQGLHMPNMSQASPVRQPDAVEDEAATVMDNSAHPDTPRLRSEGTDGCEFFLRADQHSIEQLDTCRTRPTTVSGSSNSASVKHLAASGRIDSSGSREGRTYVFPPSETRCVCDSLAPCIPSYSNDSGSSPCLQQEAHQVDSMESISFGCQLQGYQHQKYPPHGRPHKRPSQLRLASTQHPTDDVSCDSPPQTLELSVPAHQHQQVRLLEAVSTEERVAAAPVASTRQAGGLSMGAQSPGPSTQLKGQGSGAYEGYRQGLMGSKEPARQVLCLGQPQQTLARRSMITLPPAGGKPLPARSPSSSPTARLCTTAPWDLTPNVSVPATAMGSTAHPIRSAPGMHRNSRASSNMVSSRLSKVSSAGTDLPSRSNEPLYIAISASRDGAHDNLSGLFGGAVTLGFETQTALDGSAPDNGHGTSVPKAGGKLWVHQASDPLSITDTTASSSWAWPPSSSHHHQPSGITNAACSAPDTGTQPVLWTSTHGSSYVGPSSIAPESASGRVPSPWWVGAEVAHAGCMKVGDSVSWLPPGVSCVPGQGPGAGDGDGDDDDDVDDSSSESIVCIGMEQSRQPSANQHKLSPSGAGSGGLSHNASFNLGRKRPDTASPLARVALGSPDGAQQMFAQPQTARELHFALLALHNARGRGSG